jgi:hypothetical protein
VILSIAWQTATGWSYSLRLIWHFVLVIFRNETINDQCVYIHKRVHGAAEMAPMVDKGVGRNAGTRLFIHPSRNGQSTYPRFRGPSARAAILVSQHMSPWLSLWAMPYLVCFGGRFSLSTEAIGAWFAGKGEVRTSFEAWNSRLKRVRGNVHGKRSELANVYEFIGHVRAMIWNKMRSIGPLAPAVDVGIDTAAPPCTLRHRVCLLFDSRPKSTDPLSGLM